MIQALLDEICRTIQNTLCLAARLVHNNTRQDRLDIQPGICLHRHNQLLKNKRFSRRQRSGKPLSELRHYVYDSWLGFFYITERGER